MMKNLRRKTRLFPRFSRQSFWLSFLVLLLSKLVYAQNPVYINTGDYGGFGWNSVSSANNLTTSSTWAGNRIVLTPNGTGNKYFRFTSATSGWNNYGTTSNCSADVQITGAGVATSDCDTKAFFLAIANASSNVVFKTTNGAPATAKVWANEVQGTIRSVSTVTQSPISASVVSGQNVTVTATLDGTLATGQQVYIRYSTDNFSTSTIITGTVSGTTATFTIPAATNTAGAVVRYYVLTSGSTTPTHADADLMTINYNNNSGSNYSYTVNTPGAIYTYTTSTAGTANTVASNMSATSLSRINGATVPASPCGTGFNSTTFSTTTTFSNSLAGNEVTLTPNSGYTIGLTSLSVNLRATSTGPQSVRLAYSIDGGTTWIDLGSNTVPSSGSCGSTTVLASWTLSSTPIANSTNGLKIRIYGFNASSNTGTLQVLNFTANGNVTATTAAVAPTISGFTVASPGSGTSGYVGNTITLTGTGFTGVSSLKVGGSGGTTVSTFTVVNDTTITFPAIDASGQIYVLNSAGNATSTASYTSLGYITTAAGTWQTATTWLGGAVPPSAATTNVTIANNVTGTTGTINVGKITVNSAVTLTNTSGATININAASTISGTITNAGTITTAAGIANGGTFTNNGTFQINANGFISGTAPIYGASSTLVYNGVTNYNVTTEWGVATGTIGTTLGYPQNVSITNSSVNLPLNSGLAGNFTIGSGSTFNLTGGNGQDLTVRGNWSNSGTFNANTRAVFFSGTAAQTLTGATTFDYLLLNNSAGLTLSGTSSAVTVNKILTLTSGKLTLGSNNLTITNGGSIASASASNYIITAGTGQLKQTVGGTAVAFPVGSATSYNPVTFTNTGTSDVFGVILTSGTVPNVSDATTTVNDRWLVSEGTAGGSVLTVVPQWNTSDQGTGFVAGTQTYVGFYNGTSWTQNTATISGANPYTASGAASFSPTTLTGTQYFAVGKDNAFICGTTPITYSQGFNSAMIPACWSTTVIATTVQTGTKITFPASSTNPTTSPQEGSNMVRYNSYSNTNGAAGSEERLASNPLSSLGSASVDVSFQWYNENNTTYSAGAYLNEGVQIQYSLDGTTWTDVSGAFFARHDGTLAAGSGQWNLKKVTLPSACANVSKFYVGFKFHSEYGDNMSLDAVKVETSPPTLFVDGASTKTLAFGTNDIGSTVATQSFALTGANLTGFPSNITISAPSTDFQVSSDNGTTWGSSATVVYASATLASTNILVKYIPATCGITSSGNLTFSGGGVSTYPTVSVSGTANLAKPTNLSATNIAATTFTANWTPVSGATSGYELDVYQKTSTPKTLFENFETGLPTGYTTGTATLNSGTWTGTRFIRGTTQPNSGSYVLQLESSTDSNLISPSLENISSISFWMAGSNAAVSVKVQYSYDGTNWFPVDPNTPTYYGTTTKQLITPVLTVPLSGAAKIRFLRFGSTVYIDDITINYTQVVETPVSGFNPKLISGQSTDSQLVNGLSPNTQYYYRMRAVQGTCKSINSDEKTATTNNSVIWASGAWSNTSGPTGTLDAIVRDNYTVGSSPVQTAFSVNNLTIENTGLLTIPANQGITVNGDITTADNKIVIESDGSLLQTKLTGNNNSNNKIIAKRKVTMKTLDYTYWSSPVSGQLLRNTSSSTGSTNTGLYDTGGFSAGTPNNRIYQYNEPNDLFLATTDAAFVAAKGYAIRGKASYGTTLTADEFSFNGVMNNGALTIGIQKSKNTGTGGTVEHGYNMIGNPYPSHIDFLQFYNLDQGNGFKNSDFINGKAWFWTNVPGAPTTQGGSSYTANNYAILTLAGGTPATGVDAGNTTSPSSAIPNQYIKVGQGFIVQMKGTAPTGTTPNKATLKFDNSVRTNNSTGNFYNAKTNGSEINRYWLHLVSPNNVSNTILVAHMDQATNNYDADYDADLLVVADDSFYSKLNVRKLQIQARANVAVADDVVPLGAKYSMDGAYKIALAKREGIFGSGQSIYLHDKILNTYTDLTQDHYSFQATKGLDESRFEIVYNSKEALSANDLKVSDFVVYRDGNDFVVKSSRILGRVDLYDGGGRLLQSKQTSEKQIRLEAAHLVSGFYIIKAQNSGDVRTKKLVK